MDVLQRLNEGSFVKQLHQERFFMCEGMYKKRHDNNCVPIPVIHWWIKFNGFGGCHQFILLVIKI